MPWGLNPFQQNPNEMTLQWTSGTPTREYEHRMSVRTTAGPPQYDQWVYLRAACYFLLAKLPDEGLADVCRSIADAYEYYLQPPRILSFGHNERTKAKYGNTYERPPFSIEE